MKIEWTKEFPKVNGWYWVKYQWENWELSEGNTPIIGQNCCPCEVVVYMELPYLRLDDYTITEENMERFGYIIDIEFGPMIEQPDEVTFEMPDKDELNMDETEEPYDFDGLEDFDKQDESNRPEEDPLRYSPFN